MRGVYGPGGIPCLQPAPSSCMSAKKTPQIPEIKKRCREQKFSGSLERDNDIA